MYLYLGQYSETLDIYYQALKGFVAVWLNKVIFLGPEILNQ